MSKGADCFALKLGTAKLDITPRQPMPLAGFSSRSGSFERVAQPLFARFYWFEQTRLPANDNTAAGFASSRPVLLVTADLICWGTDRMPGLRRKLMERFGLEERSIIMHATHTHSGPQTSAQLSKAIGTPSLEYLDWLEEQVLEGAARAAADLETVQVRRGAGTCGINVNRRKLVEGLMRGEPNELGPVDRDVTVFAFAREDDSLKGVLTHYSCHPTISNRNEVSSEFCGAAMDRLEAELGGDVICGYLQGCTGDVRPHLVQDGKFVYGGAPEVKRMGDQLFDTIQAVLKGPMRRLPLSLVCTRQASVPLKLQPLPSEDMLRGWLHHEDIMGEWSGTMLHNPDQYRSPVLLELTFIQLAQGLSFLAMNGEVVMEYGLHVKAHTAGQVLPVAYSNGMLGYVPTARQVHEGGYEGATSFRYFNLPGPFDPRIESDIQQAIAELIRNP
ncbi:hypothetical protein PV433_32770 [Paenibacillus sp. GYB004]|uniref:neutral/alkaline non-lysosomal ceramidase N-terminal domain-containing protein n=1 Tax=Paenibacillus sp. GYB004 TaxID=2994393 RepID=UPI002F962234